MGVKRRDGVAVIVEHAVTAGGAVAEPVRGGEAVGEPVASALEGDMEGEAEEKSWVKVAGAVVKGEGVPAAPLAEGYTALGVASVGELLLRTVTEAASEEEAQVDSVGGARLAVPSEVRVPLPLDSIDSVETGDKEPGASVALLPTEVKGWFGASSWVDKWIAVHRPRPWDNPAVPRADVLLYVYAGEGEALPELVLSRPRLSPAMRGAGCKRPWRL